MKQKQPRREKTVEVPIAWFEGLLNAFKICEEEAGGIKYLKGYIESAKSIIKNHI